MRRFVVAGAFFALSLLFSAPVPASAQEYELELGSVVPPGSPWALQLKKLKEYIQEETNGRVKVKLRLGRSNERSLARRVASGSMQGFAGSVGGLSSIVREVNVLEAPYLFDTVEQADAVLDDPEVIKQVRKILEKRKLVFAIWGENGFRSYFSRRPIRTPEDMKGVRFRSRHGPKEWLIIEEAGADRHVRDVSRQAGWLLRHGVRCRPLDLEARQQKEAESASAAIGIIEEGQLTETCVSAVGTELEGAGRLCRSRAREYEGGRAHEGDVSPVHRRFPPLSLPQA